ncbi:MAG: ester cyclase [Edaphobacter sp.]|uniref:ester cyclase n=1 Tax=Edaphobacter sp. TaxID=1934404 RepID=UPI0023A5ADD5|nr:ester cyclase [Edaphobacter sp.]MDE1176588.1 ester cyclase [Edaphobacter sp.]
MTTERNMLADNREMAQRFIYECWNIGKMETLWDMVAADCCLHDTAFPDAVTGPGSLARHICSCRNGFPDMEFTIEDTIAERNEVVLHWSATGTHTGDYFGMKPTGKCAAITGSSIFRFEDGRIAEMWADWNAMYLLMQLGLMPQPPQQQSQVSQMQPLSEPLQIPVPAAIPRPILLGRGQSI